MKLAKKRYEGEHAHASWEKRDYNRNYEDGMYNMKRHNFHPRQTQHYFRFCIFPEKGENWLKSWKNWEIVDTTKSWKVESLRRWNEEDKKFKLSCHLFLDDFFVVKKRKESNSAKEIENCQFLFHASKWRFMFIVKSCREINFLLINFEQLKALEISWKLNSMKNERRRKYFINLLSPCCLQRVRN